MLSHFPQPTHCLEIPIMRTVPDPSSSAANSALATAKSFATITSKVLHSADGTPIYADAVGDPSKPSIVFVHGFGLSAVAFDGIFGDGDDGRRCWTDEVYLVRLFCCPFTRCVV